MIISFHFHDRIISFHFHIQIPRPNFWRQNCCQSFCHPSKNTPLSSLLHTFRTDLLATSRRMPPSRKRENPFSRANVARNSGAIHPFVNAQPGQLVEFSADIIEVESIVAVNNVLNLSKGDHHCGGPPCDHLDCGNVVWDCVVQAFYKQLRVTGRSLTPRPVIVSGKFRQFSMDIPMEIVDAFLEKNEFSTGQKLAKLKPLCKALEVKFAEKFKRYNAAQVILVTVFD